MEFTPYEFGSFDPTLAPGAFIDIEYLGTEFVDGNPAAGEGTCVLGFDNGAYVSPLLSLSSSSLALIE